MDHKTDSKINVNIAYTRLNTGEEASPHPALRNDIQGLRSLAIVFVLLFHMWPTKVRHGFLGVDMFFVISGYLIFMLLSKKKPLNGQKIGDFYFRRIKRIVPIYLTIVSAVLFAIFYMVSALEFKQVVEETVPALGFYSNWPNVRKTEYFDTSSKLYYFLHTWSLSVEMQFYLTVPIFFILLQLLDNISSFLKFVLIGFVPVASFAFQCYSGGDTAHMLLISRFWQFFAGFGAHYAYEYGVFNFAKKESEDQTPSLQIKDERISLAASLLLCFFFLFDFGLPTQFNRFIVILLTGLLVGRYSETCTFLTNKFAVLLGDASYSIYLIHWPLFTWHRYANGDQYASEEEADFLTGSALILVSIIAGYLVETAFKYILHYINSWTSLILVLLVGYYLNGILLYQLQSNKIDLSNNEQNLNLTASSKQLRQDLVMLWNQRNQMPNYTNDQIMSFNSKIISAVKGMPFCDGLDDKLPSAYSMGLKTTFACHANGKGKKNMVMIGNSHAAFIHSGIAHIFRDVYKRFTYFGRYGCMPASKEFQQPKRTNAQKDSCLRLLNGTIQSLKKWNEPIDILLVFYGLVDIPDVPLAKDMKTDKFLTSMQNFYSQLNGIPREVMFVYAQYPYFSTKAFREVAARMKLGKSLDTIGDTKGKATKTLATARRRAQLIQCTKCIKLDFVDYWCGPRNQSFCHSVQKQGLIYFADENHPSAYGSFYEAEHMHKLYNEYIKKKD